MASMEDPIVKIWFQETVEKMISQSDKLCAVMKSDGASESLAWLGSPPGMVPYTGQIQTVFALPEFSHTITNYAFHQSINLQNYPNRVRGNKAIEMAYKDLINTGFNFIENKFWVKFITPGNAFDAAAFYKADRTIGNSGTINNICSGQAVNTINDLADALNSAIKLLLGFKHDNGADYYNVDTKGLVIVSPLALKTMFETLMKATVIDSSTNISKGSAELIVHPSLDANSTTTWYLLKTDNMARRPFVKSQVTKLMPFTIDLPNSLNGKTAGVYWDGGYGTGDPRKSIQVTV